jgi:acyl-coenzyme A thioesterase PaaI-like protein
MSMSLDGYITGPVRCEGTVIHRGRRVATAEGRLIAERTGRTLAHGTTTCLIEQPLSVTLTQKSEI